MTTVSRGHARENLTGLIAQVSPSHEPVQSLGRDGAAILAAEEDWRRIPHGGPFGRWVGFW